MHITINNKEYEFNTEIVISMLLEQLNIPRAGTAVAINGNIVPRDKHETQSLTDGDKVDILRPIGGG